jgi:methionyl-tRNA synthetase
LRALDVPLPRKLLAHGWWQKDGAKLSKTTGNVVDPLAVIEEWGLDAFRYYLVRELAIGPDGNWTDDGFKVRYNSELANGLGNLLNRSVNMLNKYRDGVVPAVSTDLAVDAMAAVRETTVHLEEHQLQDALSSIWTLVNRANLYVEQTRPFSLAKDPSQSGRLDEVLYNLIEVCRILAVLLWPFMPETAEKIYRQLQATGNPDRLAAASWGGMIPGKRIGTPVPLFPRRDLKP